MTVVRVNEFTAAAGKAQQLAEFLQGLVPYISGAKGCQSCELLIDPSRAEHFLIIESWDCVESHQLAITNYPQEDMQAAMPLFAEPPKGNYYQAIT